MLTLVGVGAIVGCSAEFHVDGRVGTKVVEVPTGSAAVGVVEAWDKHFDAGRGVQACLLLTDDYADRVRRVAVRTERSDPYDTCGEAVSATAVASVREPSAVTDVRFRLIADTSSIIEGDPSTGDPSVGVITGEVVVERGLGETQMFVLVAVDGEWLISDVATLPPYV